MEEPTNADLMREIRRLREEVESLRDEVREAKSSFSDELVRLQGFADRMGLSRSAIYAARDRGEIVIRDKHGYPKEEGDRSASYVSITEWQADGRLATQTVRQRAGFYDD
jgi:SMC interacting uncharacterized protein involved in chromosome segregation